MYIYTKLIDKIGHLNFLPQDIIRASIILSYIFYNVKLQFYLSNLACITIGSHHLDYISFCNHFVFLLSGENFISKPHLQPGIYIIQP